MDTAAALIPSKKRKRARSILSKPHLPTELIEEILLNIPQKSLVRFSAVSKQWNSMIFDPVFARKHKNRTALLRRNRLVVYLNTAWYNADFFCSLAPISSDLRFKVTMKPHSSHEDHHFGERRSVPFYPCFLATKDLVSQFEGRPFLRACCDELWCVRVNRSLFIWNPSMRSIVEVLPRLPLLFDCLYGLAYDSVNDDYKILKIGRERANRNETVLYSLKNNCWKEIKPFSSDVKPSRKQQRCEFVDGKLHWVVIAAAEKQIIVSFDLSTEKYIEVAQPPYTKLNYNDYLVVVALRGKLCASLNYTKKARFDLWVMEEYGVEKSWTKRFVIRFSHRPRNLTPFYLSDNNDMILVKSGESVTYKGYSDCMYIFMYRNGVAKPKKKILKCGDDSSFFQADAFLYVESLITHKNFFKK